MGVLVDGECLADKLAGVARWCSAGFPRLRKDSGGAELVESCSAVADGAQLSAVPVASAASAPSGPGVWAYAVQGGNSGTSSFTGNSTGDFCAWYGGFFQAGTFTCSPASSTVVNTTSPDGVVVYTCQSGCSAPVAQAVTSVVPMSFPDCDPGAWVADYSVAVTACLLALTMTWVCKAFIFKLVANQ